MIDTKHFDMDMIDFLADISEGELDEVYDCN